MSQRDRALIEAIHHDRLADSSDPEAIAVCAAIGRAVAVEATRLLDELSDAGIDARPLDPLDRPRQVHSLAFDVASAEQARRAARVLVDDGFEPWEPLDGAAWETVRRFGSVITLAATDDHTISVRLRWPAPSSRLPATLRPNELDFRLVSLPARAWPLYLLLRPLRLLARRAGIDIGPAASLGPFLSTPDVLVDPLLDLASITDDDVFVDLGCGDGRLVARAAERFGCRAIGVETDPLLVGRARQRAADSSASRRIEIMEADASTVDLGHATTVFVFLPADVASSLIEELLPRVRSGTRLVTHEQRPITMATPPDRSVPLLSGGGVTVAHVWER